MRRFSEPQHPRTQELRDSGGPCFFALARSLRLSASLGSAQCLFGFPALAQVSRLRPRLRPTAAKHRHNGVSPTARVLAVEAKGHRQDSRRQNTNKTTTGKTPTRRPPAKHQRDGRRHNIGKTAARAKPFGALGALSEPSEGLGRVRAGPSSQDSLRAPEKALKALGRTRRVQSWLTS